MTPIKFDECNVYFGAGQEQYFPLPGHRDEEGCATFCWRLNWRQRVRLLFTGKIWHSVLTFNKALQPQKLSLDKPEL